MQKSPESQPGNGTSQLERSIPALAPDYVSVDERSVKDLLLFAQNYASQLRYFNHDNKPDGDWSAFLDPDLLGERELNQLVNWLNNPEASAPDPFFTRPHFVLFLTFLQLLQTARAQLNDFTRRHLEFFYREALCLTSQTGNPDSLHVIVELAKGQNQFLLPAGTLFKAGKDSSGKELHYRSERDLLANRGTVSSLKTLFAEKMIIGLREARETPDFLIEMFPSNKDLLAEGRMADRAFMAMLVMALGNPGPGGPLPSYGTSQSGAVQTVNTSLLAQLDALLAFMPANLYMPFSNFRAVMQLKQVQMQQAAQWGRINDYLEAAGKKRDRKFILDRSVIDNFEKNMLAALGLSTFDHFFDGLPEVDDIYDLNRRRDRDDVIEFIQVALFMTVPDFSAMMDLVEEINGRWRQIYEILREAGRRKQLKVPTHQLQAPQIRAWNADKFGALVTRTLGSIAWPKITGMTLGSFDDCMRELVRLESWFHVSAEEFVQIRAINQKQDAAQSWEWEEVYTILDDAHQDKMLTDRRNELKKRRLAQGVGAMILFALGEPNPGDPLPDGRQFDQLSADADASYISDKLFMEPANYSYIKSTSAKANASDDEWNNVYAILERAQGRKRGTVSGPAQIEKWDNLYAFDDASTVQVRLAAEGDSATPRWRTFGGGYDAEGATPGRIGLALASPVLALNEGVRVITLTLGFREELFDKGVVETALLAPAPFRFLISSEKAMVEIANVGIKLLDGRFTIPGAEKPYQHALQITLTLNEQSPPVAPLKLAALIDTPWPVLHMLLADIPDEIAPLTGTTKRYRAFQSLALEKCHVKVDVTGLSASMLQNDGGVLANKKPFEPFGYAPVAGSSFYFAHPELCAKRLDNLTLAIDWMAVPDDLRSYYLGYKDYADPAATPASPLADNAAFGASLKLVDNRAQFNIASLPLFNAAAPDGSPAGSARTAGASQTSRQSVSYATISKAFPQFQAASGLPQPAGAQQVLDWNRYWLLELQNPDFMHALYPRVVAACASKTKDGKATPFFVNPPYTPKIRRLTFAYTASLEIDLSKPDQTWQTDRLYHLQPFGYQDLASATPANSNSRCPFFLPQYGNEGELYIGVANVAAPQSLSLLFQLAEGSADPDLARQKVGWHYLDGNQWQSLEQGQILFDSTNGLFNSGLIEFNLAASRSGTVLPADQYWLRATIARNCRSVPDTVAICAQALRATLVPQGNAPGHFGQALPPLSVQGLLEPQTAVKSVLQPYSSFGGKSPEQDLHFYMRASERVRHKDRALTCWDFEHLVLEAFPSVFKVKCLPVGTSGDPRLADVISVIVIPDIKGQLPFDPFEPKLPADVLLSIEQYLASHSAPFARFRVSNASYMRLKVRLGVRLRDDGNPGYYKTLLNDELCRFLAPWAYDSSADIVFGGQINASLIINFVEKRPYVDYVAGLKLFISVDGRSFTTWTPGAEGSRLPPEAILVSDHSHEIDMIAEESYEAEFFTGISYMKLELDFQIAA